MNVEFPYDPYDVQRQYMSKFMQCLTQGHHGVLESPTGTGKTLCLLCCSLKWLSLKKEPLKNNELLNLDSSIESDLDGESTWGKEIHPKVIYSSRTHTQLSHVMKELQSTIFKNTKKTVLGSRDQLCIHPKVSNQETLAMKNALCRMHVKEKSCQFANKVEHRKNDMLALGITDIEDLLSKSKKMSCCPYYMAKELQESADIIFLPYNYLLDPQIRKSLNIRLQGSVIILDEAHNVESICEEAASIQILSSDISSAVEDLTEEMRTMHKTVMDEDCFISVEREYNAEDVCIFKEKLQKLEKILNDLEPNKSDIGVTYKGSYIFEILGKAEITRQNHGEIANLALKISDDIVSLNSGSLYSKRGISLRKFAESLLSLYSFIGPSADYKTTDINFKMYIEQEVVKRPSSNMWLTKSDVLPTKAKRVNFWCFNPGFGMSGLINNNVHCVILTSGTLSPLNATINELGLNNPVTLENPHIINPSQVLVNIIPNGPRNLVLNSSFNNRENDDYWTELGLTLQNFSRIIPQGVLVFFPSYTTLNKAQKSWQVSGLWKKINNSKPIFVEPPNKVHLKDVLADYRKAIDSGNGKGAILLGVCRGKISEGFDFRNDYCRGVLITGIPFPPLLDPRISLKKQYMDEIYSKKGIMSGETWYNCEAMRAVNQAIGRVIRHSKDFGAILLCDVRFSNKNNLSYLSKWLCPYIKKMKTFGESIASLTSFFRDNSQLSAQLTLGKLDNGGSSSRTSMSQPFKKTKLDNTSEKGLRSTLAESIKGMEAKRSAANSNNQTNLVLARTLDPQPGTSRSFDPQPGTSRSFDPQPGTSRSFDPQPGTSRSFDSQPGTSRSVDPQPGTSRSFDSQPGTSRSFDPQPGTSTSCLAHLDDQNNDEFDYKFTAEVQELITADSVINIKSAKRRKIKLVPIEFEIRTGSDSPKSICRNIRINEIKDFICEVKRTLDTESYATFSKVVKQYQHSRCANTLLTSLLALFPLKDQSLKPLLKGCEIFFSGRHKSKFISFCKQNKL